MTSIYRAVLPWPTVTDPAGIPTTLGTEGTCAVPAGWKIPALTFNAMLERERRWKGPVVNAHQEQSVLCWVRTGSIEGAPVPWQLPWMGRVLGFPDNLGLSSLTLHLVFVSHKALQSCFYSHDDGHEPMETERSRCPCHNIKTTKATLSQISLGNLFFPHCKKLIRLQRKTHNNSWEEKKSFRGICLQWALAVPMGQLAGISVGVWSQGQPPFQKQKYGHWQFSVIDNNCFPVAEWMHLTVGFAISVPQITLPGSRKGIPCT